MVTNPQAAQGLVWPSLIQIRHQRQWPLDSTGHCQQFYFSGKYFFSTYNIYIYIWILYGLYFREVLFSPNYQWIIFLYIHISVSLSLPPPLDLFMYVCSRFYPWHFTSFFTIGMHPGLLRGRILPKRFAITTEETLAAGHLLMHLGWGDVRLQNMQN